MLFWFVISTNTSGIVFSQPNGKKQIIESFLIYYQGSLVPVSLEEKITLPGQTEKIIININNPDSVLYTIIRNKNIDTLWTVLKQSKLKLNYIDQGKYTLIIKSFNNDEINHIQFVVQNTFVKNWKYQILFIVFAFALA